MKSIEYLMSDMQVFSLDSSNSLLLLCVSRLGLASAASRSVSVSPCLPLLDLCHLDIYF